MRLLLFLAMMVAMTSQQQQVTDDLEQWELFKTKYGRTYQLDKEEEERKKIFMDNFKLVHNHNERYKRGKETFLMAINKFADMTENDFKQTTIGYQDIQSEFNYTEDFNYQKKKRFRKNIDWRKKGALTNVKNQGHCGSSYAFSVTGSLEGLMFLKTKNLVSLSEQNLIDCSSAQGNSGCLGGKPSYSWNYIMNNTGISTEKSYPYLGYQNKTCSKNDTQKSATITGYVSLPFGREDKLQAAVATKGPISIVINASLLSFRLYNKGVYSDKNCSENHLNHAALLVGYGVTKRGKKYWIVKNSWGTDWGMKGYMKMSRNIANFCGVASLASYPMV